MMGNTAVGARKIITVIHWGDAFVSIANSKNTRTVLLVQPQACYEPAEFSVPLPDRKCTICNLSFENNILYSLTKKICVKL